MEGDLSFRGSPWSTSMSVGKRANAKSPRFGRTGSWFAVDHDDAWDQKGGVLGAQRSDSICTTCDTCGLFFSMNLLFGSRFLLFASGLFFLVPFWLLVPFKVKQTKGVNFYPRRIPNVAQTRISGWWNFRVGVYFLRMPFLRVAFKGHPQHNFYFFWFWGWEVPPKKDSPM